MNKKIVLSALIIFSIFVAGLTYAEGISNPIAASNFGDLLERLYKVVLGMVGAAGIIGVIISGFLFLASAGDPGKLGAAKTALIYSVLGIVVGFGAEGIAELVKSAKTGNDFSTVITNIAGILGNIIAIAGSIMVVVAGAIFVTSGGDPGKVNKAKSALIYAFIGIVIGLGAKGIVELFKSITGAS